MQTEDQPAQQGPSGCQGDRAPGQSPWRGGAELHGGLPWAHLGTGVVGRGQAGGVAGASCREIRATVTAQSLAQGQGLPEAGTRASPLCEQVPSPTREHANMSEHSRGTRTSENT